MNRVLDYYQRPGQVAYGTCDQRHLGVTYSDEAYYYLRNVNSGHPGSITSVHASSAILAFEQLTLLVKESPGGRDLSRGDIHALLHQLVDIVVQCGFEVRERVVREVWFKGMSAQSEL